MPTSMTGQVWHCLLYTSRAALDELGQDFERFAVKPAWQAALGKVSEGIQATLGAYNRPWR